MTDITEPDVEIALKNLLTNFSPYQESDTEKRRAAYDLTNYIADKLTRKKFRKQKLYDVTRDDIKNKVKLSIEGKRPLHLVIPFGAYKHFWNPSHPEPDWAELFSLKSLTEWVSPVLAVFSPGVIIEFISEALILPRMNNYPEKSIEDYSKTFNLLLEEYKKYIPKNLGFRFFAMGDRYNKEKIIDDVEKMLPDSWKKWETYTPEQKEIELKRSRRSVFWNGKADLTKLSPEEKERRMIESRLIELAYYTVEAKPEFLGNYYMEDNHIPICFSYGLSPDNSDHWIVLGSTNGSTVDFWIGRGILERRKDEVVPRIISHLQYEQIKTKLKVMNVNLLPFNNFKSVEIYDGVLNFN